MSVDFVNVVFAISGDHRPSVIRVNGALLPAASPLLNVSLWHVVMRVSGKYWKIWETCCEKNIIDFTL